MVDHQLCQCDSDASLFRSPSPSCHHFHPLYPSMSCQSYLSCNSRIFLSLLEKYNLHLHCFQEPCNLQSRKAVPEYLYLPAFIALACLVVNDLFIYPARESFVLMGEPRQNFSALLPLRRQKGRQVHSSISQAPNTPPALTENSLKRTTTQFTHQNKVFITYVFFAETQVSETLLGPGQTPIAR